MTLVKINAKADPNHMPNTPHVHFGYEATLNDKGELIADIPEALIAGELAAGRVALIQE